MVYKILKNMQNKILEDYIQNKIGTDNRKSR